MCPYRTRMNCFVGKGPLRPNTADCFTTSPTADKRSCMIVNPTKCTPQKRSFKISNQIRSMLWTFPPAATHAMFAENRPTSHSPLWHTVSLRDAGNALPMNPPNPSRRWHCSDDKYLTLLVDYSPVEDITLIPVTKWRDTVRCNVTWKLNEAAEKKPHNFNVFSCSQENCTQLETSAMFTEVSLLYFTVYNITVQANYQPADGVAVCRNATKPRVTFATGERII